MGRINLTRIYTRLGDDGSTHLGDMSRVPKTDPRIEAYGSVDELNTHIGVLLATADLPERFRSWLSGIQNDLFDIGADLCLPEKTGDELTLQSEQTRRLEEACDEVNADLPPLTSFVLPGGSPASALLHVCRAVCRRAERRTLAVEEVNVEVLRYLNRLSDFFFILGRAVNEGEETLWRPGGSPPPDSGGS